MKLRLTSLILSTITITAILVAPASAQLPGGAGNAANRTQAQTQQRVQAQVQQRVQAQVQQRTQAQVQQNIAAQAQARVQAEAARAAHIAQQAAILAQRKAAAARQNVPGGVNARVGANARVGSQARVGNQSANANANARLGIAAGLVLPPGVTKADVQIYDNIFGRFNPLRARPQEPAPRQEDTVAENNRPERRPEAPAIGTRTDLDLAARIEVAVRQRRAEISEMRDRAVATANTQLLLQAERTEQAMTAFVDAQAKARQQAAAQAEGARKFPRTAQRPATDANASGNAQANGNARVNK